MFNAVIETQNQQAKQMFQQLAQKQKNIINLLEGRYHQILEAKQ
ncbi:DUF1657 domain-containing protein [Bacillus sp. 1P02SD]